MKRCLIAMLMVVGMALLLGSVAMADDVLTFPIYNDDGNIDGQTIILGPSAATLTFSVHSDTSWRVGSAYVHGAFDKRKGGSSTLKLTLEPVSGSVGYASMFYIEQKVGKRYDSMGYVDVVQLSAADYARYQAMRGASTDQVYFTMGFYDAGEGATSAVPLERHFKISGKKHALVCDNSFFVWGEGEKEIAVTLFGQPWDSAGLYYGTANHVFVDDVCTACGQAKEVKAKKTVLSASSRTVMVGESVFITPFFSPANANPDYSFESSDLSAASVDPKGVVTALDAGSKGKKTVTIRCITTSGKNASIKLTVIAKDSLYSFGLYAPKQLPLMLGSEPYLIQTRIVPGSANVKVGWVSSVPGIATVNEQGYVTPVAVAAGKKKTTDSGKKASVTVRVLEPSSKNALLIVNASGQAVPPALALPLGADLVLSAKVLPSGALENGTWKSSNPKVAKVELGVVKPVGPGKTVISCKVGKLTAKLTIEVP